MSALTISLYGGGQTNFSQYTVNGLLKYRLFYPCTSISNCQPYQVRFPKGLYQIECWGAQGVSMTGKEGGYGGYTSGFILMDSPSTFFFNIGASAVETNLDIYNGGGRGTVYGGSGGGATDMRYIAGNSIESLMSRVMVAGAGSGATRWGSGVMGAHAGGISGNNGNTVTGGPYDPLTPATGAAQTSGGLRAQCSNLGVDGVFGVGGKSGYDCGAGGGAGYFGGGGGGQSSNIVSTGGGGSSYISGHDGCLAVNTSISNSSFTFYPHSIHQSNRRFSQTTMISGGNIMPTPFDTQETGNKGYGSIRITIYDNRNPSFECSYPVMDSFATRITFLLLITFIFL